MNQNEQALNLGQLYLTPGNPGVLFSLFHTELGNPVHVSAPSFEIDGRIRNAFIFSGVLAEAENPSGGKETKLIYTCGDDPQLTLKVYIRSFSGSPILRFRYELLSSGRAALTKSQGHDQIEYFRLEQAGLEDFHLAEVQLSHFDPVQHAYTPNTLHYTPDEVLSGMQFAGPIGLFHSEGRTLLAAYEHGADHPHSFLQFQVVRGIHNRAISLQATKGNYPTGQEIGPDRAFESVWFEIGYYPGPLSAFLKEYRRFFLSEVSENHESRQPYIFYNTWNYQERQKYFHDRPYLESMNADRILAEIEIANRLGVDVFVVDTGWYKKTGDWLPNLERFPQGLYEVKQKLDRYGMKLGLWFNPTVAALTSDVYRNHPEWEMEWEDKPRWRGPVWETEESTGMCLASGYADYFIEALVRLYQELGVTYFKWDGISQYGCDSAHHNHGTEINPLDERRDCYAYQMGRSMIKIADEVSRRCPGVIVDFDITEGGRFVGLGFLSAGKYFLVNNGPYFSDFDIPRSVKITPDTINVFFYPGPARPRICRQGIKYDEIIPSILFLTHYLPDPPRLSQRNSMASLVLGGNGLWGDLLALGENDIEYQAERIALYKAVAGGVTRAFPRKQGFAGSSPEIYEKIDPETCCGVVVFFTVTPGTFIYFTQSLQLDNLGEVIGARECSVAEGDRLKITATLEQNDAVIVFILPKG